MRRFIKSFVVFIYLILALFLLSNNVYACDYIGQNFPVQYYIFTAKSETHFINNKNEEYYVFSKNNNRTNISNLSNKKQNFGFGGFDKVNVDFIIPDKYTTDNSICPTCISYNISSNLKNAIYTRAP